MLILVDGANIYGINQVQPCSLLVKAAGGGRGQGTSGGSGRERGGGSCQRAEAGFKWSAQAR